MSSFPRQVVGRIVNLDRREAALEAIEWAGPTRGCRVIRTTAATIQNITLTTVAFSTALFDLGACWSPAVSTHLIAPRDGVYLIQANIGWANAADSDGQRLLQLYDQDGNVLASDSKHGSSDAYVGQHISATVHMDKADYAVVKVYQSSGSAKLLSTASAANQHTCHASLIRMG